MKAKVMCSAEDFQERVEQFLDDVVLALTLRTHSHAVVKLLTLVTFGTPKTLAFVKKCENTRY